GRKHLSDSVRIPVRETYAKSAQWAHPGGIGSADDANQGHLGLDDYEQPAYEPDAIASEVDRKWPNTEKHFDHLAAAMDEACNITARGPVRQVELDLFVVEAGSDGLHRPPHLAADARG